jgi:hypothetical protein
MDPYLEARWSDVHLTLIAALKEALQPMLPRDLRARAEERLFVESPEVDDDEYAALEGVTTYRGDIAVIDRGSRTRATATSGGAVAMEPILVEVDPGPIADRFIQILDVANKNRVVTAIEILSPWNKKLGNRNLDYLRKIHDYLRAQVNLVEIDLLRIPRKNFEVEQELLPSARRAPYLVCTRRGFRPERWEVYPMPLREPLPHIPIPLRRTDADAVVHLQPLIDRVYAAGAHDDIDYSVPPDPPLEGDDAAWADALLRNAGRRR